MFDDTKLREIKEKLAQERAKKTELTKDINKEINKLYGEQLVEETKQREWEASQKRLAKAKGKSSYMNLIFSWPNGTRLDTRDKGSLTKFKDYVFAYGLPTDFEVRG